MAQTTQTTQNTRFECQTVLITVIFVESTKGRHATELFDVDHAIKLNPYERYLERLKSNDGYRKVPAAHIRGLLHPQVPLTRNRSKQRRKRVQGANEKVFKITQDNAR